MLKSHSSVRWVFRKSLSTRQLFYEKRGAPEKVIQMRTVQLPDKLESEQVLVKWIAGGINPSDINQIQGTYYIKPKLPAAPGIEGVGRVVHVGSLVNMLKVGDQVITDYPRSGTWSEHGVFEQRELIRIDKDLRAEDAALIKVNPTSAYTMLKDFADLKQGDWVLQNCGNSAVGKLVIQMARILGYKTMSVVRNRENINELVKELKDLGADEVITDEQMYDRKSKVKLPRVKLALNGVGGRSSMHLAGALDKGGCMVTYGGMSRESVQSPTAPLIFKNISLRGFWLVTHWAERQHSPVHMKMLEEIAAWLKSGEIVQPPFVSRTLDDHVEALNDAQTKFDKKQVFFMNQ